MKALFLSFSVLMASWAGVASSSVKAGDMKTVVVGVVASVPRAEFNDKFQSFFKDEWQKCGYCEVKNLTPYDEKGEVDRAQLPTAVNAAQGQIQVLFLSWNEAANAQNQEFVDALKKMTAGGVVLVGPAGEPAGEHPALALSRTVMGQVPDAVIIGDLNERESLRSHSFYGPEMLTSIKPPRDMTPPTTSGLGATLFTARLAREWNKKTQAEWLSYFHARKSASRRIWPGLDEFFGR